jgi:predicted DNA-binding protein with PD1-like motif
MAGESEMHSHRLFGHIDRTFLLVLDDGEELIAELARFAAERGIAAAEFTGIGSFADVQLTGGRGCTAADIRSLDGRLELVGGSVNVVAYVVVRTYMGESCAGRVRRGVVGKAVKLVFTEGYSGSRARPFSTETRPSPLNERRAS